MGCAITGGTFYDPPTGQFPSGYVGDYFFADLCSGWIRRLDGATGGVSGFATGISRPVDLEVSKGGSLYYLSRGDVEGSVERIRYTGA
jgi:glucose/arabinose dehydrogenase